MKSFKLPGIVRFLATMTLVMGGLIVLNPSKAVSATVPITNTASGDIGGIAADLNNSNIFTINKLQLALIKRAFLSSDNSVVADNAVLAKGTMVKFLIYVNNMTASAQTNVNLSDTLDALFAYQAGTIKVGTMGQCINGGANDGDCTAAEENTLRGNIEGTGALIDNVTTPEDVAGINGATISAGSAAGNDPLGVAANTAWGIMFEVQIQ